MAVQRPMVKFYVVGCFCGDWRIDKVISNMKQEYTTSRCTIIKRYNRISILVDKKVYVPFLNESLFLFISKQLLGNVFF